MQSISLEVPFSCCKQVSAMDALKVSVAMDEVDVFPPADRALYSILASDLWRDPLESVQVLAFWRWIEQSGCQNLILNLLSLLPWMVGQYADEAITCLRRLNDLQFVFQAEAGGVPVVPLTSQLLQDKISPQFFHNNRGRVAIEIQMIIDDVYSHALLDLVGDALRKQKAYENWASNLSNLGFVEENPQSSFRTGPLKEDRTLFITFSRGFPLCEEEVRSFLTTFYGDCIEAFHMQPVNPNEQALYARVVLRCPSTVNSILQGAAKAKFAINGKHLWIRKFVAKPRTFP